MTVRAAVTIGQLAPTAGLQHMGPPRTICWGVLASLLLFHIFITAMALILSPELCRVPGPLTVEGHSLSRHLLHPRWVAWGVGLAGT